MTEPSWREVSTALLGSWPNQVAGWGRAGLAAYLAELEARGLSPAAVLAAIRASESGAAPSVPELLAGARRFADPGRPTAVEAYSMLYDPSPACGGPGVLWTRGGHDARIRRAYAIHPLLGAFVNSYGLQRLELLEVEHETYGAVRRRELLDSFEQFAAANEQRDRAALLATSQRRLDGGPKRLDPAALAERIRG